MSATETRCGNCVHAAFERTPTGRIKKLTAGSCTQERVLLEQFTHRKSPPCLVMDTPRLTRIWPDYDASQCPAYTSAAN